LGTVVIDEPGRGSPCSIQWTYPDAIRQRLVRPSQYTKVLLEVSSRMRSYAAAVLYELGARYLTSPSRLTMREDVIWWASVLTGRSDITTVDYRILRRDTVKKALAELDALNDEFRMEVIEHKRGRKVEELQFRVVVKAQPDLRGLEQSARNVFDLKLVERIEALGFKRPEAEDLYATTDEGAIRAALEHVEARQKNSAVAPLGSPAAYFKDALKKGYAGSAPSSDAATAERQAVKAAPPSMEERLQQLRDDWYAQRATRARERFAQLPDLEQARLIQRFEDEQLPEIAGPIAKMWRRDGMKGRVAASAFYRWLASDLWPGEATDAELLQFALGR
jgi:Initiator Replication protein